MAETRIWQDRCKGVDGSRQKQRFPTRPQAEHMKKRREWQEPGLQLFVYACRHCDGFHLTRRAPHG